ncbi:MAG: Smr/MutS family protein [Acidobacteriota bacterium]|nr:Smr/MutS family protein [Acidobacteriota bacterium]MDH3783968.1 Smr/MutS family protein [Acidobacteriota bacterium]
MTDSLRFDDATSSALGFAELLDWLAKRAVTPPGREALLSLRPHTDRARLEQVFDGIDELRQFRQGLGRLVPRGLPDPMPSRRLLASGDRGLDPSALRALAGFLVGSGKVRERADDLSVEQWPVLRSALDAIPTGLLPLAQEILKGVDPDGNLTDSASPELGRIRRRQRESAGRLQKMLEGWMREPARAVHLQDTFVTQRNQRFVVPVKTDSSGQVAGIVHDHSSTGSTRFIEPLETVELNNERVQLRDREREEERRILLEWKGALLEQLDTIDRNVEQIAILDGLEARAEFADRLEGCRPSFGESAALSAEGLRHPLLIRHFEGESREVVPLEITVDAETPLLVISGPNAGGKTVVLKSLGLAVLMAQSGIPPLATRLAAPIYERLFADIGDHQSIDDDLSTYSGHVASLRTVVEQAAPRSLLLIDEIGSGTDPAEGAALAQAFLERYLRPGFTTIATTHHGPLKRWAYLEPKIDSAAMEFDDEAHRPTYRMIPRTAGSSAGLDVAERLGLPADLLSRARELLGEHGVESERFMRRLREAVSGAEKERDEAQAAHDTLQRKLAEIEGQAKDDRREIQVKASRELDRALQEFRKQAGKQLRGLEEGTARRAAQKEYQTREAAMRMEHRRRDAELGAPEDDGSPPATLQVGMSVRVHSLARVGTLVAVDGERADVKLGSHSFNVSISDLRVSDSQADAGTGGPRVPTPMDDTDESYPTEIVLIGERVVEALEKLDRYLDEGVAAGLDVTRIVHGHGTGKLRNAVREYLRGDPRIKKVRPGDETEGGNAATIATLR